jgi:GNAT superfamily N-acetyltransferase
MSSEHSDSQDENPEPVRRFRILPAETGDLETILALQKRAFHSEAVFYGDFDMPPMTQTLEQIREEASRRTVLKLVEGEVILGSARGHYDPETRSGYLGRLAVEPGRQGQGLGTLLVRAIEALFPQATRWEIFTGARSEGNIRLYRKLGYVPFKEVPAGPPGSTAAARYNMVVMEKLLERPPG